MIMFYGKNSRHKIKIFNECSSMYLSHCLRQFFVHANSKLYELDEIKIIILVVKRDNKNKYIVLD